MGEEANRAFRTSDARAGGVTRGQLRTAVGTGRIRRLARGVYAASGERNDQVAAAVLRVGGGAVASHETAAELWEIPLLGRPPPTVQLTRPRRRTGTDAYPGITVHHAAVPSAHWTVYRGIRVTTPARTVVDIARGQGLRAGVSAADGALRRGRCSREALLVAADDCAGWPGVRQARRVARFADPLAANPLESISRVAFHDYGLPRPQLQVEVLSLDIVDFLWVPYRVAGEADGMLKYDRIDALRREKLRQERLEQDGLAVVRWTWPEAFRRPDAVADRVARTLQRRGWSP